MKKNIFVLLVTVVIFGITTVKAQNKVPGSDKTRVEVYYFHPNERCPIDQSIEENTVRLISTDFAKEIKEGRIKFQVINTDDQVNAKLVANFDINAQALYVVKIENGKEIKKDLTKFAFDYGQSNPVKFKAGLKEEIRKAFSSK